MAKTKTDTGNRSEEDQNRVDELLANPNRQPADDAELDKLLHGPNPVKTGDVSVDPVGSTEGGTGLVDRATLRGEGGGDDVHREIPNPHDEEAKAEVESEPVQDATEAGASRAGSNETKRAGERQPAPKGEEPKGEGAKGK